MIRLIVDSTFGVSEKYAKKNKIEVVNLKMILDGQIYDEGFENTWDAFYEKMKNSKSFPTTSQPSPQDFMDAIDRILKEDENAEILILTIANSLSGTINSATIAANSYPNKKIVAHDTQNATTCCRLLTEEVIEHIKNGISFDELLNLLPTIENALKIQFIPDNMDALKRGGRIGTLSATLANILKIKPLFKFANGKITITKKVLGLSKAISDAILELPKKLKKLCICYIYDKVNVPTIVEKLKTMLNLTNVEEVKIEPVFGVHVGIGAIGLASLEEY